MIMRPGMTFTIEPMITLGTWQHKMWDDGWTAVTADGKRTAQFEHTVLVTDEGAEILTVDATGHSASGTLDAAAALSTAARSAQNGAALVGRDGQPL